MTEMDFNEVLEKYINHKREILEDGIFLSSDYLPSDKHLQFYRNMSELVSEEDSFKRKERKTMKEEQWIKEEDSDSWNLILEMEKSKYV